jgi:dTDP-4-amino-4,6-dideoxygalactose transaminase
MSPVPISIPMLNLARQFAAMRREILAEVEGVFSSQQFILGEQGRAFEREVSGFLGVSHAIAVSSGTDALLVSLMALDIGPGDEVVVPAFSFFASAGVVSRLGATPVFADIEPADYTLDPASFESKITPRTKAVMPVHLYGRPADMLAIGAIASRRGIAVVEDACQAIGARFDGRPCGALGRVAAFSFFPTKNLGAAGDAGLVTTEDASLAERVRHLRVHGMNPKYYHSEIGGNFRMDEIQAAVLRVKLRRLGEWNRRRREIAAEYGRLLSAAQAAGRIVLPGEGRDHTFHQYVVRVKDRDAVRERLSRAGIGSEIYYPVALHLQKCFEPLGGKSGDHPESERAAAEVLAIPIWPELSPGEVLAVGSALADAVR